MKSKELGFKAKFPIRLKAKFPIKEIKPKPIFLKEIKPKLIFRQSNISDKQASG